MSFMRSFADKVRPNKKPTYQESSIFPVLTAKQMIIESERMKYNKRIAEMVRIPDQHFRQLYLQLIDNYLDFVQMMPVHHGEPLGGLLQEGLRHGFLAVQLLIDTSEKTPEPLFTYAVFSMAILADVVKVMQSMRVMISNEKGTFIREWCPFNGSLKSQDAHYYKLRSYDGHAEALLHAANPILAKQLMPQEGMAWIASDSHILDIWLACLTGHEDWAGKLGHLKKLLKALIDEKRASEERVGMVPFDWVDLPAHEDPGEEFLKWLKHGLDDESISVNEENSKVHILEEGIFIDEDLFKDFTEAYSHFRDWTVVQAKFNSLGLSKLSGYDFKFEQFFSERPDVASKRFGFMSHEKERTAKMISDKKQQTQQKNVKQTAGQEQKNHKDASKTKSGLLVTDKNWFYDRGKAPVCSENMKMAVAWAAVAAMPPDASQQMNASVQASARDN